jgi:serine protease
MVFSTVSERPLSDSISNASAISDSTVAPGLQFDSGPLASLPIGASSIEPLAVSPGVRVTISDAIGDTWSTAFNLGDLNNVNLTSADRVDGSDINDFYRFRLNNSATVNLGLTGMSADADLFLFDSAGNRLGISNQLGNISESISRVLSAGTYYVLAQSFAGSSTAYNFSINASGVAVDPGSDRSSARDLGNLSRRTWTMNDAVGTSDQNDFYRFDLSENGNFHLTLSGLGSDIDVALCDRQGNLITSSVNGGSRSEAIDRLLDAGSYYIRVYPYSGSSNYNLRVSSDTPAYTGTRNLVGTLGADTFDVIGNYTRTVISGGGNVDFGSGRRDVLDLSALVSTSVSITYANDPKGGVFYDPGNGTRVFDSILLNDGRQVLFEGIDQIRFSDRTISLSITPNDTLFSQQWNLGMMDVQGAWRFTTGSNQVMIGIEDSGIALSSLGNDLHSFFYNSTNGYRDDFFDEYRSQNMPFSHGTAVQSIIGATSNNGLGMAGINWNSDFFVTDVIGSNAGDYTLAQATNVMAASATSRGQRLVINMSLGIDGFNRIGLTPAFEAAVAANPNVLFVIAAGNDGDLGIAGLSYPATLANLYSNVMAVGASWGRTDDYGRPETPGTRIEYPGWWGSQFGDGLTLMGPSEVVAQAATRSLASGQIDFGYRSNFNGTSAATPNVTGVASLVWSVNPDLTATQVRQIMTQTATDLGATGYDRYYGNGFVNADAAVRRAIAVGAGYA